MEPVGIFPIEFHFPRFQSFLFCRIPLISGLYFYYARYEIRDKLAPILGRVPSWELQTGIWSILVRLKNKPCLETFDISQASEPHEPTFDS